ncbi:unnamed protein product [Tilletia caries]|nr:unnamed protein product [Tilletia caries]
MDKLRRQHQDAMEMSMDKLRREHEEAMRTAIDKVRREHEDDIKAMVARKSSSSGDNTAKFEPACFHTKASPDANHAPE